MYGVPLVPLVVLNTVMNTAPFWASIIGWFFLNESISSFEIVAMVLSFGGVVLITMANNVKGNEIVDTLEEELPSNTLNMNIIGAIVIFFVSWI